MLLKSLNYALFHYTYKACPYVGKSEIEKEPYYIDSAENYVHYLVNQTANNVELQGQNISMDRLYITISLVNWLLGRNITCVGTLNHDRQGILTEFKKHIRTGRIFSNLALRVRQERSVFTFIH